MKMQIDQEWIDNLESRNREDFSELIFPIELLKNITKPHVDFVE